MARYEVQHRYRSNNFGPWEKGDQINLDSPEDAAYVNRDSPGTLVEIDPTEAKKREKAQQQAARVSAKLAGGK